MIVAAPARDPPAPDTLDRLAHEYALKDELEPDGRPGPWSCCATRGRTLLVLEDPAAFRWRSCSAAPMETGRFLRLAVGLVEAVGKVHERGLIHKDLRPANILVDEAAGAAAVHLTGFGLASRLPRERPPPDQTELSAGALAYMAPEQTGRMNRSVDSRSDLYAVGVVLYEMLTGALPFSASDPIGVGPLSYRARADAAVERVPDASPALSAVIMKCLAKTAEDRYQTAAGLAADLKRCLAEWERRGDRRRSRPAPHDVPDTLRIPEKLYGREARGRRGCWRRSIGWWPTARPSWSWSRAIPASASPRWSTSCTRRSCRRAACSPRASSTSTSATSPMPPWRRRSRA